MTIKCQFVKEYFIEDVNACDEIINIFESNKHNLFENHDVLVSRKDQTLHHPKASEKVLSLIHEGCTRYIKEFGLDFYYFKSDRVKIQKTEPGGGFHHWHCEDSQPDIRVTTRKLVWTLYLNDVEEGGETEFLHQSLRVKPEKGKLAIFPASFTHMHRGNPPLSNTKYIATGWINHDILEVRHGEPGGTGTE